MNSELLTKSKRAIKARLVELLWMKMKKRALMSLHFFDRHILGYKDMTDENGFHGELCKLVAQKRNRKVLVLEPRGSLKSSCITVGYPLRAMVKHPNIRILICSE